MGKWAGADLDSSRKWWSLYLQTAAKNCCHHGRKFVLVSLTEIEWIKVIRVNGDGEDKGFNGQSCRISINK